VNRILTLRPKPRHLRSFRWRRCSPTLGWRRAKLAAAVQGSRMTSPRASKSLDNMGRAALRFQVCRVAA